MSVIQVDQATKQSSLIQLLHSNIK